MNKHKAYFEENVVPYRQKIRQLETENHDLRIENDTIKAENNKLINNIHSVEQEVQDLLLTLNMTPEERQIMLEHKKEMLHIESLLQSIGSVFKY